MQKAGQLSPEQFWARYTETEDRVRAAAGTLPCYGLDGWSGPRLLGEWGWENDQLVTVGLAHGAPDGDKPMAHVRTTVHEPHQAVTSLRMAAAGPPRGNSDFLHRYHQVESAAGEQVSVPVDGTAVVFTAWRETDRWWAAASYAGYGLVLQTRHLALDDVRLVRVHDIEPYLAGRRAHLRARRGED